MFARRPPFHPIAALALLLAVASASTARGETPFEFKQPLGFPAPKIPADNPLTWEKVELGRLLFYDTRLSGNETFSCASCHQQDKAFTDGRAQAIGSTDEIHPRNSMSLANVAYNFTLTWANPNQFNLAEQALIPLLGTDPVELGLSGRDDELFARLAADTRYQRMFAEAFPGEAEPYSLKTITRALASFQRTLVSGNSPFDRYVFGIDDNAISPAAVRGSNLFFDDERVECFHCHAGFNLSTSVDYVDKPEENPPFHNNALYNLECENFGLPKLDLLVCDTLPPAKQCDGPGPQAMGCYPPDNTGVYEISGTPEDMGRFKAPTLRNIAVTAPYMHDGSIATLEGVLAHYEAGGRTLAEGVYAGNGADSPNRGQFIVGFADLPQRSKDDLLAFLLTLTDDEFLTNPRFSDPFLPVPCAGDCDLNGAVAVSDMITSINISLGSRSLALCLATDPNGDGAVTVNELIRGIAHALNGCG
ncbi:MAG: MbnH family di-heme enzyme [Candidatus Binatia bacterium]